MRLVADIHPHPRVGRFALAQHGHDSVVGGHYVRGSHRVRHQRIQRLDQIGHVAAPDRLRGSRDLEPLPREDVFQPIKWNILCELAGNDVGQKPRSGQALVDRRLRFGAVSMRGLSPFISQAGQAYFLRT